MDVSCNCVPRQKLPYELLQDPPSHGSNVLHPSRSIGENSLLTTCARAVHTTSVSCPDLLKALLNVAIIPLQTYSESNQAIKS